MHNNNILCILTMFLDAVICSRLPFYYEMLLAVKNEQDWDIFPGQNFLIFVDNYIMQLIAESSSGRYCFCDRLCSSFCRTVSIFFLPV